jgi:hypothetical protein
MSKKIKVGRGMVMPNPPSKEEQLDYCFLRSAGECIVVL